MTPLKGKIVKAKARYAKTPKANIVKFEWKYGINKDSKVGTYKVRVLLRENKKQIRAGTFRVKL